jgi:hypothetical protein
MEVRELGIRSAAFDYFSLTKSDAGAASAVLWATKWVEETNDKRQRY